MRGANKPFLWYIGFFVLCELITGLCIATECIGASGIFASVCAVLLMLGIPWGIFPNPINVRNRNITRLIMFLLLTHLVVFGVVGTSDAVITALKTDNIEKSAETVSKTCSSVVSLGKIIFGIVKFESANLGDIRWVYLIIAAGFLIPLYKYLRSWGWPCVISSSLTIAALICCLRFWKFWWHLEIPWKVGGLIFLMILGFLSWYFGKQTYHTPAIA